MRLIALSALLLLAGCKEKPAISIEENTNLVKADPDLEVVFEDPPVDPPYERPPPPTPVADDPQPPKVKVLVTPKLTLEPDGMTTADELREVKVSVAVEGVDPTDLAVEFTAPEGLVFNRQQTRLEEDRYHHQQAEFSMPVSGTTITAARMYGTWHAKVFLGKDEIKTMAFEVLP